LNLYYKQLNAATVTELPPLAVFIENKCVLQYDAAAQHYVRTQ
jgi:hypothetical protein